MGKEKELTACISGSFKFKPEIDRVIEEFQDLGVAVLAPEKGWLAMPKYRFLTLPRSEFRPLPSEKGMGILDIENEFLKNIGKSNFLYVVDINGYVGGSVGLELGFAIGREIPIYLWQEILNTEHDLWYGDKISKMKIATPKETIADMASF